MIGGWRLLLVGASLTLLAGACGGSGKHAASTTTQVTHPSTSTSTPVQKATGTRTVLSPIGVNVRAQPERTAKVLGTAAQDVVLRVLGHTASGGGWFEVKGATVTGWISDDPTLSSPGEFLSYSSGDFAALYPIAWSARAVPPASVVFQNSGPGNIVVTHAASLAALPAGQAGYGRLGTTSTVVCGVTSDLVTYQRKPAGANAPTYLVQVRLSLDAHHALGIEGNLIDLGQEMQTFDAFLASITFPSPQCEGR